MKGKCGIFWKIKCVEGVSICESRALCDSCAVQKLWTVIAVQPHKIFCTFFVSAVLTFIFLFDLLELT